MQRKNVTFTQELIEKVKSYYMNTPNATFSELANDSSDIFGTKLTAAQIKYMSDTDTDGRWEDIKNNIGLDETSTDSEFTIPEQVDFLLKKLFKQMQDSKYDSYLNQNITAYTKLLEFRKNRFGSSDSAKNDIQKILETITQEGL